MVQPSNSMAQSERATRLPTIWSGCGPLLAALLLAGCASTGNLQPLATVRTANGLQAGRSFADAALIAAQWPDRDWWRDFGDRQLDRLEAEALAGSPTLGIAQARVAKARALAGSARSALAPQLDLQASSTRQRYSEHGAVPKPLAGGWATDSRTTLEFGYEFDLWGKNRAVLDAALNRVEAAEVDRFAARLMLTVAVARTYVQLAHRYELLDIEEATLAQRQRIYALTRDRVGAGLDTQVELKQAEAALPATREAITALHEAMALERNQLAALLGQGPDRGLSIERPAPLRARAVTLPSRLPAKLVGRRPDVVAQRWRVQAASKDIDAANARFYPDINLLAFVGLQSIGLSQFLQAGSRIAGIGPALSLPVFDGGRLRSALAASNADYDAAVEQYNQTLVQALHDIADQLVSLRAVEKQDAEQELAIGAAQQAYDLSLLRYREGVGNYLAVLSAEAQVLTQKRLAADLRARSFDLGIALVRALGGGWQGDTPDTDSQLAAGPLPAHP